MNLQRRTVPGGVQFWFYQVLYLAYPHPAGTASLFVIVLPDGSVVEPNVVDPAPAAPVRSEPLPSGVTAPRVIREVNPQYTQEALRQKIAGSVFIQGVVGVDGMFHDLHVIRSLDPTYGLDDAALKAAAQWRFIPGSKDGQPVPVSTTIELTFSVR